jgi:hypothetical protein
VNIKTNEACIGESNTYESVSKSFRTGHLKREPQTVQLSANKCSCIDILWVSLVSFAAIILCAASQRVFIVYFVIGSVRKILDTPSYHRVDYLYFCWHAKSIAYHSHLVRHLKMVFRYWGSHGDWCVIRYYDTRKQNSCPIPEASISMHRSSLHPKQ